MSISLLAMLLLARVTEAAEPIGSVFLSFGENRAIGADRQERILRRSDELFVEDRLFTSETGQLQLRFIDGSRLALKPSSEFVIADFQFNPQQTEGSKTIFKLLQGGMRTLSGQIGKSANDDYRMETLVATIGIRGTYYGAQYTEQGLYIETLWGIISVTTKAGTFEVRTGQAVLVNSETGEVEYIEPTGLTAPSGFRLIDGTEPQGESGFTDEYWERWTGVRIGIEDPQQPEGAEWSVIDPVSSFNNLANRSGSYTYNYATTLSGPLFEDGNTGTFDDSSSMTVNWGTQMIEAVSVTVNPSTDRASVAFTEVAPTSLDSVLSGGQVPVSNNSVGFPTDQLPGPVWTGTLGVQFLGSDASGVAIDLNASNGAGESVSGAAVLE